MNNKSKLRQVNLDDLELDLNNPRFAELYSGSQNEDDLIEYLLYSEAADEVAKAIVSADEFYPDRPLWVVENNGKYLVKDGNRRCSAVKALQMPGKFKLNLPKTNLDELPVLIYNKIQDIDARIVQEHAGNLFRRWERIAKALEVYKLFNSGSTVDSMKELDSQPADLIKLASFYYDAVKIGGDDLKQLLRRGRGKNSGRTIIFERLFKQSEDCGYRFKRKPAYVIEIFDKLKFEAFIKAVVNCLLDDIKGEITTDTIDKNLASFFEKLKTYGFDRKAIYTKAVSSNIQTEVTSNKSTQDRNSSGSATSDSQSYPTSSNSASSNSTSNSTGNNSSGRGSTKKYPLLKRKQLSSGLKDRIDEYFKNLDSNTAPNAKIAMARVLFECVMKFVIEETKYNGQTLMSKSNYFNTVYSDTKFTDFRKMKHKFIDLIIITKDRNAMISFDLDHLHQVVHNYKVSGISTVADQVSSNLIELIEFMLKDEADLLLSLDLTKLN
ncbi:hypothetical protein [Flavobacterium sp. KJJ]|uniref:hypothetical protein n=1 Tax=Flavobacterium sp. KJJ TaxID=1270193 RepID=UPI0004935CF0|nr:hypothetical protein [Flavobacterium sp. KJJ]